MEEKYVHEGLSILYRHYVNMKAFALTLLAYIANLHNTRLTLGPSPHTAYIRILTKHG